MNEISLLLMYWADKYLDLSMMWAEKGIQKYDSSSYLDPRPKYSGAEALEQARQERLAAEAAKMAISEIAPERYDPPSPEAGPNLSGPYENVSLEEKIRLQNILGGSR